MKNQTSWYALSQSVRPSEDADGTIKPFGKLQVASKLYCSALYTKVKAITSTTASLMASRDIEVRPPVAARASVHPAAARASPQGTLSRLTNNCRARRGVPVALSHPKIENHPAPHSHLHQPLQEKKKNKNTPALLKDSSRS